jgi:hypothetical protein
VESIRRWWHGQGQAAYPQAERLLITADAGGSNGYRTRAWKLELARLAADTGLTITVCHLPPGTSKWNKIEHRLFSHITMNWRGRPLTSHEVIVQSIAATTTRTGLHVTAELDTNVYPTGVTIGEAEMAALPLTRHAFHGDWNYVLHPHRAPLIPVARTPEPCEPEWTPALLTDPALTGMSPGQLHDLVQELTPDGDPQRGRPPRLAFHDQVLATVLHLHVNLAAEPLAVLFASSRTAMHRTLLKIRKQLEAHGIVIPPAATPPAALTVLHAGSGSEQRGQQQDQDDVLMICKPLARRMMSRASQGLLRAGAGGNASRAQTALPVAPEGFHPHPSLRASTMGSPR